MQKVSQSKRQANQSLAEVKHGQSSEKHKPLVFADKINHASAKLASQWIVHTHDSRHQDCDGARKEKHEDCAGFSSDLCDFSSFSPPKIKFAACEQLDKKTHAETCQENARASYSHEVPKVEKEERLGLLARDHRVQHPVDHQHVEGPSQHQVFCFGLDAGLHRVRQAMFAHHLVQRQRLFH